MTLFEKYGGFKSVSRMVMTFYDKAIESDQIGDYFEDVDLARLIDHQTKFISSLLGGPAAYTDEQLRRMHATLQLSHADFDEMSKLLGEALTEHGMSPGDVAAVIAEVEARRAAIVWREGA